MPVRRPALRGNVFKGLILLIAQVNFQRTSSNSFPFKGQAPYSFLRARQRKTLDKKTERRNLAFDNSGCFVKRAEPQFSLGISTTVLNLGFQNSRMRQGVKNFFKNFSSGKCHRNRAVFTAQSPEKAGRPDCAHPGQDQFARCISAIPWRRDSPENP